MTFEEEFKATFFECEDFNIETINNFRDFVDYCNFKDGRYIYKDKVKRQLDYWIGSLDDDWVIRNIKKELRLEAKK